MESPEKVRARQMDFMPPAALRNGFRIILLDFYLIYLLSCITKFYMMSLTLIVLLVVVLLALIAVFIFNRFVRNRNQVKDAWSNIDAALKRRHDLVPNLVNSVKGYAAHEAGTLEKVIKARNAAATIAPDDINGRIQAENNLGSGLRHLFALAERYPDLKANTNFLDLQQNLSELEEGLERSRRYYNATVRQNNSFGESFPGVLFAGAFGYQHFNYFEVTGDERVVPKVEF